MAIRKRLDDDESREFWEFAQKASEEVANWPAWKRGETTETRENDATEQDSLEAQTGHNMEV
jgi:hypothetical protein